MPVRSRSQYFQIELPAAQKQEIDGGGLLSYWYFRIFDATAIQGVTDISERKQAIGARRFWPIALGCTWGIIFSDGGVSGPTQPRIRFAVPLDGLTKEGGSEMIMLQRRTQVVAV